MTLKNLSHEYTELDMEKILNIDEELTCENIIRKNIQ